MFAHFRPALDAHYVDEGCVRCPLRARDVEVDLCAGCDWLTQIDLQAERPFVRCQPTDLLSATRLY